MFSDYPMPSVLTDIPEVKCCYEIAADMKDFFAREISRLDTERDTETATEFGISRKEKMYGIKPSETDTLEERRLRIKRHEQVFDTLTVKNLKKIINELTGGDTFLHIDKENKSVLVSVGLKSLKMLKQIRDLIRDYLPVDWTGEETVLYKKFRDYSGYTFAELSDKTFNELMRGE